MFLPPCYPLVPSRFVLRERGVGASFDQDLKDIAVEVRLQNRE